jgi:hypothetical protein
MHALFHIRTDNTNIDVSVCMVYLRMINMSSECEYDWYWKISVYSTEYEVCDSFASVTRQQASYSGSTDWYFRYWNYTTHSVLDLIFDVLYDTCKLCISVKINHYILYMGYKPTKTRGELRCSGRVGSLQDERNVPNSM